MKYFGIILANEIICYTFAGKLKHEFSNLFNTNSYVLDIGTGI